MDSSKAFVKTASQTTQCDDDDNDSGAKVSTKPAAGKAKKTTAPTKPKKPAPKAPKKPAAPAAKKPAAKKPASSTTTKESEHKCLAGSKFFTLYRTFLLKESIEFLLYGKSKLLH